MCDGTISQFPERDKEREDISVLDTNLRGEISPGVTSKRSAQKQIFVTFISINIEIGSMLTTHLKNQHKINYSYLFALTDVRSCEILLHLGSTFSTILSPFSYMSLFNLRKLKERGRCEISMFE
jgi:hypothetical protein